MNVKLIFPPFLQDYVPIAPLGIASITSYLKEKGFDVEQDDLSIKCLNIQGPKTKIINLEAFDSAYTDRIFSEIKRNKITPYHNYLTKKILALTNYKGFDIVAFSIYCQAQLLVSLLMAQKIKTETESKIVFAGPYIKEVFRELLDEFTIIDFVIHNEGEIAFEALINSLEKKEDLQKVPGIAYIKDNKLHINPVKYLDVDEIPPPNFDGLSLSQYPSYQGLPIQLSKGCLSNCAYCTFKYDSPCFKEKSISKIIHDISYLKEKYKVKRFNFMPSNALNNTKGFVLDLCKNLIKEGLDLDWRAYIKPFPLNEEMIKLMKQSGCEFLFFGVESVNQERLRNIKKKVDVQLTKKILRLAHDLKIRTRVALIYGFPYETIEEFHENLNFIKENYNNIDEVNYNRFRLERNSYIFNHPEEYKIRIGKQVYTGSLEYTFDEINRFRHDKRLKFINDNVRNNDFAKKLLR
ncbi:MAG: radical SAM protein [Nanoarchaeota archaeon]|nr:radical SAM protein [Nanoarchaeota archaeon]MBU1269270.1 radical SAM protein [Nanoarchaeota archaeon]MBU1604201.1 radical SAM protein [Nanoarchaeota archaeon]MBU2442623.1 radical SAM protein [Nanoarchaeota archaeon]